MLCVPTVLTVLFEPLKVSDDLPFILKYTLLSLFCKVMSEEIQTTMRLLGVTDLSQLNPSFLNFSRFSQAKDICTFSSKL